VPRTVRVAGTALSLAQRMLLQREATVAAPSAEPVSEVSFDICGRFRVTLMAQRNLGLPGLHDISLTRRRPAVAGLYGKVLIDSSE
jgi:hypothetical protein